MFWPIFPLLMLHVFANHAKNLDFDVTCKKISFLSQKVCAFAFKKQTKQETRNKTKICPLVAAVA
jgi:hypothetical protein